MSRVYLHAMESLNRVRLTKENELVLRPEVRAVTGSKSGTNTALSFGADVYDATRHPGHPASVDASS